MSSSDDEFTFNLQPYIDEAIANMSIVLEAHAEAEVLKILQSRGYQIVPDVEVQWATYAIGVFGPRGQNATFYDTEDEAWAAAQRASYGGIAPGTRKRAVINGEEYFTEWKTLPKTEAEIKEWRAKTEPAPELFPGTQAALDALTIRPRKTWLDGKGF